MKVSVTRSLTLITFASSIAVCSPKNTYIWCSPVAEKGWDISHHNNNNVPIDWAFVKKRLIFSFIIAKCTTGGTGKDNQFNHNWSGMRDMGDHVGKIGAYHFFTTTATPEDQLQNILTSLNSVGFNPGVDLFAVDFEKNKDDPGLWPGPGKLNPDIMADRLYQLLALVETKLGILPWLYTNNDSWENWIASTKYDFGKYPLWLADYRTPGNRQIPSSWDTVYVLQYTQSANFAPVVQGSNDLSCRPIITQRNRNKSYKKSHNSVLPRINFTVQKSLAKKLQLITVGVAALW